MTVDVGHAVAAMATNQSPWTGTHTHRILKHACIHAHMHAYKIIDIWGS